MTARTRLGSTVCRDAAWSMAASISCAVNGLPLTKLETCCEVLTSAAAERAARMLADATGFQACAVGLQYISPLLWIAGIVERRGATGVSSLTKTLRPEVSMLVVMLAEPAC